MNRGDRRRILLVAALAVAVVAVVLRSPGGEAARAPGPAEVIVLRGGEFVRADARTLRPRGRGVAVGAATAFARRGRLLAVSAPNESVVNVVDVRRMAPAGRPVELGLGTAVDTIQWLDDATFAVVAWGSSPTLLLVDAHSRRVVARRTLPGTVLARATAPGSLVLLLGPAERVGPATLAVVDRGGRVRTLALRDVTAGLAPVPGSRVDHRQLAPGLAVDPAGRRAVVVPPGGRVAEVALDSLRVELHDLARHASLLGRLRNWLEPAAHAKSVLGPERHAVWAGDDAVAVVALEQAGIRSKGGEYRQLAHARGVELIDTRRWSVRTLSERAGGVAVADGTLLVYGGAFAAGAPFSADRGPAVTGLDGFAPAGGERFRVLPSGHVGHVVVGGTRTRTGAARRRSSTSPPGGSSPGRGPRTWSASRRSALRSTPGSPPAAAPDRRTSSARP